MRRGRITPRMEVKGGITSALRERSLVKSPTIPKLIEPLSKFSDFVANQNNAGRDLSSSMDKDFNRRFDVDESRGYPVRSTLKKEIGEKRADANAY